MEGAYFTCFTGTKVHILTQKRERKTLNFETIREEFESLNRLTGCSAQVCVCERERERKKRERESDSGRLKRLTG